jgi:hypothetical protein
MTAQKSVPFVVYRQGTAPAPPDWLGVNGSRLWRDVLQEFDIADAPRLAILEQACAAGEPGLLSPSPSQCASIVDNLTPASGASGPHDFAVRRSRARLPRETSAIASRAQRP